jgi:hypothetical protein
MNSVMAADKTSIDAANQDSGGGIIGLDEIDQVVIQIK